MNWLDKFFNTDSYAVRFGFLMLKAVLAVLMAGWLVNTFVDFFKEMMIAFMLIIMWEVC